MSPTYSEYLRLEELLKLQTGIEGETREISNDELHFILVHQNFELWFKLVINELNAHVIFYRQITLRKQNYLRPYIIWIG